MMSPGIDLAWISVLVLLILLQYWQRTEATDLFTEAHKVSLDYRF
jgi:hypothetical protein